jgi:hypothetical protein
VHDADVCWRERGLVLPLRDDVAIEEIRHTMRALAASGLLKFFECPLI